MFDGHTICACLFHANEHGERLLAIADHTMIPRILQRLLNENEFFAGHGIRSVSKIHADRPQLGRLPVLGETLIAYEPGESSSYLFGGNSNWRGPVWIPISYSILQVLTKFHRFLGPDFTVTVPALADQALNLRNVADLIAECMIPFSGWMTMVWCLRCPGTAPSRTSRTGETHGSSINIFMAKAGLVSGLHTRPAGAAWSPILSSGGIHWRRKRTRQKQNPARAVNLNNSHGEWTE